VPVPRYIPENHFVVLPINPVPAVVEVKPEANVGVPVNAGLASGANEDNNVELS